jgi:ankyrin repeat protein
MLLEYGADKEAKSEDEDKQTPLHYAASKGYLEFVRLLLKYGANIHAKNAEERTPLHCAAMSNQYEVARMLLDYSADKDAKDCGE